MAEASSTEDVITLRIRFKSETFEKFAERYAADLTHDEIFIRTREPLSVGTPLAFDFSLNDGTPLIAGRGAVGWTRGPEEAQGAPTGMGIHFETLTDHGQQMLSRILEVKARLAGGSTVPPAATPERREPARARRGANADRPTGGKAAPAGKAPPAGNPPSPKAAAPTATATPAQPTGASSRQATAHAPVGQPVNQPTRPAPGGGAGQPSRPVPDIFFDDGDQERTELAQLPNFFQDGSNEGSEEGSEPEKTKLQDPEVRAALFSKPLDDEEDGDVTNVRVTASMYNRSVPSANATTVETRPPPWDESPPPLDESAFRLPAPPLVISTTTEPIPTDPGLSWRPLAPPAASTSPAPLPSSSPAPSILDRELFAGLQPGSGTNEPRWSTAGSGGDPEAMTATDLPPTMGLDPLDPNALAAPAWQVPSEDPGAHAHVDQASGDEAPKSRLASLKTWAALTVAAGGIVAAALLLLPAVLRPSPPVGEMSTPPPEETSGAPAEGVPLAPDPAAAAKAPGAAEAPVAPSPGATPEGAKTPPSSAAGTAPTPGSSAPPAPTPPPPAALNAPDPAPAATPSELAPSSAAEVRERPGRRRGVRRSTTADRAAPGEIDADPTPPIAAPAGIQADGNQEVYWLTVRSVPAGADVLIDGQVEGTTPFVRRIFDPTRNYTISVRRPGFEPHERTLGASDQWTRRGSVRTLTVLAKLNPASGAPVETQPPPVAPSRMQVPTNPPTADPPPVAPPAVESDRKTNPFAEPASPGGTQPQ